MANSNEASTVARRKRRKDPSRVLEVGGARLPLRRLEVTTLRALIDRGLADLDGTVEEIARGSNVGLQVKPRTVRGILGGLLHHLLVGEGLRESPTIAAWRARQLAREKDVSMNSSLTVGERRAYALIDGIDDAIARLHDDSVNVPIAMADRLRGLALRLERLANGLTIAAPDSDDAIPDACVPG